MSAKVQSKIYTKSGDFGLTKNILGKQKSKAALEFELVGTLDELNAALGLLSLSKREILLRDVGLLQSDLFRIGSYFSGLAFNTQDEEWLKSKIMLLEKGIDLADSQNVPLKNFILPSGSYESAHLHFARTVCRRTERVLVNFLAKNKSQKKYLLFEQYLNRLSDFLFVLARFYNHKGKKDIIWRG